jgi:hypothetical protein
MSVWWNSGVDGRDGEEERPGVGEVSGLGCQLSPEGNAPQRRLLRLRWHLLSITNYQFVNIYNEARDTSTSWCTHTSSIPSDWWMIVRVELAPVEPRSGYKMRREFKSLGGSFQKISAKGALTCNVGYHMAQARLE